MDKTKQAAKDFVVSLFWIMVAVLMFTYCCCDANHPNCKASGGECGSHRDCCSGTCVNAPWSTSPGKCS